MKHLNANSFGAQSEQEVQKDNWKRLDCLVRLKLRTERDASVIRAWFNQQPKQWVESRKALLNERLQDPRRLYR